MERFFQLQTEYGLDNHFLLHYGDELQRRLYPFQEIFDTSMQLGIVSNSCVSPRRLLLLEKDRLPLRITIPETGNDIFFPFAGKSAFIMLEKKGDPKSYVTTIVKSLLNGEPDRRDHLHAATVGKIRETGWVPFWAPLQLQRNALHVRMVAERTLNAHEDPTEEDALRLAQVFTKFC